MDPASDALVQSLGSTSLDASACLCRWCTSFRRTIAGCATIGRIEKELSVDGFVYRYLDRSDGLPGREATFLICSFWLVDNLALTGQAGRAGELFERLCDCANDVGLLSEEIDPRTGELLGHFPRHSATSG